MEHWGSLIFDWKGCFIFLPLDVHVNYNSLAIVFSLKDMNNIPGGRVTMDTLIDKAMSMIMRYGTVFKLKEYESG